MKLPYPIICEHCKDTGDLYGQGYLDCIYCDAAIIIAKYLEREKEKNG